MPMVASTKIVSDEGLQGDAPAICAPLAAEGLQIVRDRQREFANYLSGARTHSRVTVVHRTGWHEIENDRVFVLPGREHQPQGCRPRVAGRHGAWSIRDEGHIGLNGAAVLPRSRRATQFRWLLFLPLSPDRLLHLAGLEGGGLNLFGQSSRGKTTCLQAAASVWGRGATPGYVRAWRATANELEGAAAQSTDTFMVLDELGMVNYPGRSAGSLWACQWAGQTTGDPRWFGTRAKVLARAVSFIWRVAGGREVVRNTGPQGARRATGAVARRSSRPRRGIWRVRQTQAGF